MVDEDLINAFKRLKALQDENNKVSKTYLVLNHYQVEELERIISENYIHKDKIREYYKKLNITDVEPWSTYKISGSWLFEWERMCEEVCDKKGGDK